MTWREYGTALVDTELAEVSKVEETDPSLTPSSGSRCGQGGPGCAAAEWEQSWCEHGWRHGMLLGPDMVPQRMAWAMQDTAPAATCPCQAALFRGMCGKQLASDPESTERLALLFFWTWLGSSAGGALPGASAALGAQPCKALWEQALAPVPAGLPTPCMEQGCTGRLLAALPAGHPAALLLDHARALAKNL